jgi:hypothetical protein
VIAALARIPLARVTRSPRAWLPVAGWAALAVAAAFVARAQGGAYDHVITGTYGSLVLPLLAYSVVGAALGARALGPSCASLVAFGAPPARVALATAAVAMVATAVVGAVVAAFVAVVAHGSSDPPVVLDALTSAWVGALGGAAYASLFSFGASFGRRGGGRSALLVVDFLFGAGSGVPALVVPRAHLRNLLGGTAPMRLPGFASAIALVVLTAFFAALALRRARRG